MFFLSSCYIFTNTKILTTPNFNNEEYEICNILKNSTYFKSNIFLEVPKDKTKKSAITFLNNKNLAVLFYSVKEIKGIRMAIFSKINNNWEYISDIALNTTALNMVSTLKNDIDNKEFLIIGYTKKYSNTKNNNIKICTIFESDKKILKNLCSFDYDFLTLCDVNCDNIKELIFINTNPSLLIKNQKNIKIKKNISDIINKTEYENSYFSSKYILLIASLTKKGLKLINYADISSYYDSYCNIITDCKFDKNTLNSPCLFLSINKQYSTKTYILKFDKNSNSTNIYTIKNQSINSSPTAFLDINKDFKLEFPRTKLFPGYKEIIQKNIPLITEWLNLSNNKLKKNMQNKFVFTGTINKKFANTYINYNHKYGIKLPTSWKDKVTAKFKNNNCINFFVYEDSLENDFKKILSIQAINSFSKENTPEGFFYLTKKNNICYYANLHNNILIEDKTLKLSKKELEKMFFTID